MVPSSRLFEGIDGVLSLNSEQSEIVKNKKAKYKKLIEDWYSNEGKEMRKIRSKAMAAAKNKDLSSFQKMKSSGTKSRFDALVAQERKLLKDFEKEMFSSIPADKLDLLKAHQISFLLLEFLKPLNITAEQKSEIKEAAVSVIEGLKNKSNWRGYGTSKLEKTFGSSIILNDQKDKFDELKKKNKLRMLRWNNS